MAGGPTILVGILVTLCLVSTPVLTVFFVGGFFWCTFSRHISFAFLVAVGSPIQWLFLGSPSGWVPAHWGLTLWGHPSGLINIHFLFAFAVCVFTMPVEQSNTVVIHARGLVAAKSSNAVVQMLSKKLNFNKVRTIQFIPGGRIRVTFNSLEYRNAFVNQKTININGIHHLNITESDDPITNVYVH